MKKLALLFLSISAIVSVLVKCSPTVKPMIEVKLCSYLSKNGCKIEESSFNSSIKHIYSSVSINGATVDDSLSIKWYYLGDNRVLIEDTTLSIGTSGPNINLKLDMPDNGWPFGIYEVEILLENKEPLIKCFSIK